MSTSTRADKLLLGRSPKTSKRRGEREEGAMQKFDLEPHTPRGAWLKNGNRPGNPNNAPRCGARTRRGTPCEGPAMRNGRCRMHGGASTGPRTPEGLDRARRAHWKHGLYSSENVAERKRARD